MTVIVFMLTGCQTKMNLWEEVVNKEWSNFDIWAGHGLYFHEDNGIKYCTFMVYGSGVPVANYYEAKIEEITNETLTIILPSEIIISKEKQKNENALEELNLTYIGGAIYLKDFKFELDEKGNTIKSVD